MEDIKAAKRAFLSGFRGTIPGWFGGVGCGCDVNNNPQLVVNVVSTNGIDAAHEHVRQMGISVSYRVCVTGFAEAY